MLIVVTIAVASYAVVNLQSVTQLTSKYKYISGVFVFLFQLFHNLSVFIVLNSSFPSFLDSPKYDFQLPHIPTLPKSHPIKDTSDTTFPNSVHHSDSSSYLNQKYHVMQLTTSLFFKLFYLGFLVFLLPNFLLVFCLYLCFSGAHSTGLFSVDNHPLSNLIWSQNFKNYLAIDDSHIFIFRLQCLVNIFTWLSNRNLKSNTSRPSS